jgi:pyridoxal phosphate enzyme (YggS family)
MSRIAANLQEIRNRIDRAARKVGRDPEQVRLVAVSKRVPVERLREAHVCGQRLFGENYLQEAEGKIAELGPGYEWHFIGHLQSNKAAQAAGLFDLFETVDRLKVATALNRAVAAAGRVLPVLLQVNIGCEPQKSGVLPEEVPGLLKQLQELPNLTVRGLMVMPPFLEDPEAVRPFFRQTRELALKLADLGLLPPDGEAELSMGMSGDYEVAVEEGATLVRVGTALFGARN